MSTDLYVLNTKATLIPDKNIITREKIGTQAKRCLSYFKQNKTKIHKIETTIPELIKILKDFRKSLDIICIYEALGLLTRVTPTRYIYSGFRGIPTKFIQYESGRMEGPFIPVYDEIVYQGKVTSIKGSMIIGNFVALLLFEIYYYGRTTTKGRIEQAVQSFANRHKEINTKNLSQDVQNILVALNFIQKNQTTQIITYVGPQFNVFDDKQNKNETKLKELLKKQEAYFYQAEHQSMKEQEEKTDKIQPSSMNIENFHPMSFAILKSKHWQFPIQSLSTIIGRSGVNKSWQVNLDLPYRGVSRQHAVLLYNFQARKWQIRCLSKKNLIKVDGERFAFRDRDIFLRDRSNIQIGPESFTFCLAETKQ